MEINFLIFIKNFSQRTRFHSMYLNFNFFQIKKLNFTKLFIFIFNLLIKIINL